MSTRTIRVAAVLCAAFVLCTTLGGFAHAFGFFSRYESVISENGIVTLDTATFKDGKARFYTFDANGRDVRFFVLKSRDGVIRAAFDACDVCYREGKGYEQSGDFMVCINCGQRFHSERINVVRGGCNPAPLTRTFDQKSVRIIAADIAAGAQYF